MIDLIGKNILFDSITNLIEVMNKKKLSKHRERELLIDALGSLNQAIIETKNFI